jgi:non-canonical (house-cleaning) NTP pyrophosphatase
MSFALRAIFWIAIVAAFAPASVFSSDGMEAPDGIAAAIENGQRLQRVCSDLPELCELAGEAGGLATIAANESMTRIESWLAEREAAEAGNS